MDLKNASETVINLTKEFITLVERVEPGWTRAFWRFESEDARYGSNASYESPSGIFLIGAIKQGAAYERMNELGRQLWDAEPDAKKRFCVCLLVVDSAFNYELKFERQDIRKWKITKMDGASGLPAGL